MANQETEHPACAWPAWEPPLRVPLTVMPEHPCPYLPDRTAQTRGFAAGSVPPELYHRFMDAGFRRSGNVIYQPVCRGCRACWPIRVPVERFAPSKSQRRCRKRNADLVVTVGEPTYTDERYELYRRYVRQRHGEGMPEDRESFTSYLCETPVQSVAISYRTLDGRLVAVGICDVCSQSLSSVYFYYEPEEMKRGLGTFGAMVEIEVAEQMGIPWYYLGYWIAGCRTMEYKASFRPFEVMEPEGVWREQEMDADKRKSF